MTRTSLKDWNCSVARTLDIIGDKWTMMIIRNAFFGTKTFSGFQAELGIARNILSTRLKHLTQNGILKRVQPEGGGHSHYKLTAAGRDLHTVLIAMLQWGDKHVAPTAGPPVRIVERITGAPIETLRVQSQAGDPLTPYDVTFKAAPDQETKP